ncbi:MAG TPA: HNH endonuclease [Roseateles sp.]
MKLNKTRREALRMKFGGLCAYCGNPLGDRWHADHFEPLLRQDWLKKRHGLERAPDYPERDRLDNMMPACAPCNLYKLNRSLEDFRRELGAMVAVLERSQSTFRHALRFGLLEKTPRPIVFHFERVAAQAKAA